MSYAESYDALHAALSATDADQAVLGDVFLPYPTLPDLSLPIGVKLERSKELVVPKGAGEVVIAATCRFIGVDQEKLSSAAPDAHLTTFQGQAKPDLFIRQSFDWAQETHNGPITHHTRIFRGVTRPEMVWGDSEWETYRQESSAGEDVFGPMFLMAHVKSDITHSPEVDDFEALDDHFKTLVEAGEIYPEFRHLKKFEKIFGRDIAIIYPPEDFAATVRWSLDGQQEL